MNHTIINDIKKNLASGFTSFIKNDEIINWSGLSEFINNFSYNVNEIIKFANYIEGLFLFKNKPCLYTGEDIIHIYFLINLKKYLFNINDKNILIKISEDFNIFFSNSKKDTIIKILLKWINLNKICNNIFFDKTLNKIVFNDDIMNKLKMEFLTNFSLNILNDYASSIPNKPDDNILVGIIRTYNTLNNQLNNKIKTLEHNAILTKKIHVEETNIMHDKIYNLKKKYKELNLRNNESSKILINSEEINKKLLCIVCISEVVSTIGKRCKHISCCKTCSLKLQNKCPICRDSGGFEHIYLN